MGVASCSICDFKMSYFQSKDQYSHYLCQNCKTISVYPIPRNLDELYSDKSNYAGVGPVSTGYFKVQRELQRFLEAALIKFSTSPKILDIGCSTGSFLSFAKEMGFVTTGVEPSQKLSDHAKSNGHEIVNSDFLPDLFLNESFDIITCFDVIEHVSDPKVFLQNVVSLMSPTSYLLIKTPNMNSLWANLTFLVSRKFRLPSSVLTPPHHVHNFTNQSLDYLANLEGLKLIAEWDGRGKFLYEIGQLHLWKEFKSNPNFTSIRRLMVGYLSYVLIYIYSLASSSFSHGFNMTRIYILDKRRTN